MNRSVSHGFIFFAGCNVGSTARVCLHNWLRKTVYDYADRIHSLSFLYTIEKHFQDVEWEKYSLCKKDSSRQNVWDKPFVC